MKKTNTQRQGEELNQLSRLIFNDASRLWIYSIIFEIIGICVSILTVLINFPSDWKLIPAFIILLILAVAYFFRIRFEYKYDDAETMRRQSVLTEALNWPIEATQFSDWILTAGQRILDNFKVKSRDENYYCTNQPTGPRRLLEMTIESAFFTRHIYCKIKKIVWYIFAFTSTAAIIIIGVAPIGVVYTKIWIELIYILYLSLPLIISIDFLGWGLRLNRLTSNIKEIEKGLERLEKNRTSEISEVMRLVYEYNCQVISGFPIPNFLFKLWHDQIEQLWNKRHKGGWSK